MNTKISETKFLAYLTHNLLIVRKRTGKLTLQTVLIGLVILQSMNPSNAQNAHRINQYDLADAQQRGDVGLAGALEKQINVNPVIKHMIKARFDYDMKNLLFWAKTCERGALKKNATGAALRCNTVARGTAINGLGDAHEYFARSLWAKTKLFPALHAKTGKKPVFGDTLDHVDLPSLAASTPSVKEKWVGIKQSIPIMNTGARSAVHAPPQIQISINGHTVDAYIDTGIASNVVVTQPFDAKLGLQKLVPHLSTIGQMGKHLDPTKTGGLSLAKSVKIGPLTVQDLAIETIAAHRIPEGVYIGLSMLRRFGEVTFSKDSVVLSRKVENKCKKAIPMVFASGDNIAGKLVFDAQIGQKQGKAELDTGSSDFLVGNQKFFSHDSGGQGENSDSGQGNSVTKLHRPMMVAIGNDVLSSDNATTLPSWSIPADVVIGNPVLDLYTVRLHLGDPSICFERR